VDGLTSGSTDTTKRARRDEEANEIKKKLIVSLFSLCLSPWNLGCGSKAPSEPAGPDQLTLASSNAQTASVAGAVSTDPSFVLTDGDGRPRSNVVVRFISDPADAWVPVDSARTDANGRVTTRWYLGARPGVYTLSARAGTATAASTATAAPLVPGVRLIGRNAYVDFMPGDLPLILSAPHGGTLTPAEIPNRTVGESVRDTNTDTLATTIGNAFQSTLGHRPHVIIMRLHRSKVDANREIVEGAQGNQFAETAWREFQGYIDAAKEYTRTRFANGFYIDLHGHGHTIQRLELGYLLSATELAGTDAQINALANASSLRSLVQGRSVPLSTLLKGPNSIGAMFESESFPAVPSPANPDPAGNPYFSGGYNTDRHGSRVGGVIDGLQIEANFTGVRDNQASWQRFAAAVVDVMDRFFTQYYTPLPSPLPKASAIGFATIPTTNAGRLSIAAVNRMITGALRGVQARER
jgi:hypothetical protein